MKHIRYVRSTLAKFLAIAVFSGVLALSAQAVQAAAIKDMNSVSDYAKEAVSDLVAKGIIKGGGNGNFSPKDTVTRGHIVIMLVRALNYDTSNVPSVPTFKDVPAGHWAYKYVEAAYREGIITKGSKGTFGINQKCTREQMAIMFVRSLGLEDEQINKQQELINVGNLKDKKKISPWATDHIEFVMESGLMGGVGNSSFAPQSPANRQQAAVVIYRYLNSRNKTTEMVKAITGPVQYPELYEALKSGMQGYKGELSSNAVLKMYNRPLNEDVNFNFSANGAVNNLNTRINSKMEFYGTGLPSSSMEYETITVGKELYMKLPGESKWLLLPTSGLSSQDAPVINSEANKIKAEQFVRSYRKLAISSSGQTEVNGIAATKYEITLTSEAFKTLFSLLTAEGYFDQPTDMEQILKSPFSGKVVVYLDQQNRIIKDIYHFSANMKFTDANDDVDIDSSIETSYINIGSEIEINAPPLSEVINTR
ncbi:MAG: S-layer homology domain-containing protein [Clostridia bacterium]|nr:S-layer homology domain-containing protein [Clostridia bacterium]